jgi:hypothetical protein
MGAILRFRKLFFSSDIDTTPHIAVQINHKPLVSMPAAARAKAWVCGRSLAGIVSWNPTGGGLDVCLM